MNTNFNSISILHFFWNLHLLIFINNQFFDINVPDSQYSPVYSNKLSIPRV